MKEEDQHARLKVENEARLVEEARLKYDEEEDNLWLKAEKEVLLVEELRLKVEYHECARLKVENYGITSKAHSWTI